MTPLENISLGLEIPQIGPKPKAWYAERRKTATQTNWKKLSMLKTRDPLHRERLNIK